MIDANPFLFMANVRMLDPMLYFPKIELISWPKGIKLDFIKSFDLSLDWFEVTVEVDPQPTKNHGDGPSRASIARGLATANMVFC